MVACKTVNITPIQQESQVLKANIKHQDRLKKLAFSSALNNRFFVSYYKQV